MVGDSRAHLQEMSAKLQMTLTNFGVNARVTNVVCGPTVTQYEICLLYTSDVPVTKLDRLVSPVPFIPETRNIDVLFKNMQSQKKHMVIVVDEYGQTAGLVSMEDILEEIVGNILDEHDAEEMRIIHAEDGSCLLYTSRCV